MSSPSRWAASPSLGVSIIFPLSDSTCRDSLFALRGKTHQLHSAVALAEGGQVTWTHIETAHLTMRQFSPEFLGRYLSAAGPQLYQSTGAYHLDGTMTDASGVTLHLAGDQTA